jgi:hypothetical protein
MVRPPTGSGQTLSHGAGGRFEQLAEGPFYEWCSLASVRPGRTTGLKEPLDNNRDNTYIARRYGRTTSDRDKTGDTLRKP